MAELGRKGDQVGNFQFLSLTMKDSGLFVIYLLFNGCCLWPMQHTLRNDVFLICSVGLFF